MNNKNGLLKNPMGVTVGRRRFLISSVLGAAGLSLYPFKLEGGSLAQQKTRLRPLYLSVQQFAESIGALVLNGSIFEYMRSLPEETVIEIGKTQNLMTRNIYFDRSLSKVYGLKETSYFFYPAQSKDGSNACAAFFDGGRSPGAQRVALIGGPTLYGMGKLAEEIAKENSAEGARRLLLPRETVQLAVPGTLREGYNKPDVFRTDEGTVITNYETKGDGWGRVTVTVRSEKGDSVRNVQYEFEYRA
jgi:hypothetical protein